jgi:YgiT-type zinc finger domain-containing protein
MICPRCRQSELKSGKTTLTLERGNTVVVIRDVPADICGSCGEAVLSEAVAQQAFDRADVAVKNGAEVEIVRFAA